nr:glycosyl hydrolase [Bacillus cereus]
MKQNVKKYLSRYRFYILGVIILILVLGVGYLKTKESFRGYESLDKNLVNPNATKETRALINYLADHYGKNVLAGQQDISGVKWLEKNVGRKPAVVGFDFYSNSPAIAGEVDKEHTQQVEEAIEWEKQGGIVTFCWHWVAPKNLIYTEGKDWKKGFYTDITKFDVKYAMDHPESEDYKLLLRDIDAIALQMKKLQKAGVPVLFRPLHEAEGTWFWWGAKGPESAKKLYILMFDRLTNYHKINNLIWVWNSVSKEWYPGDKYVDIVSYDSYLSPGDYYPQSTQYDNLVSLVQDKKMVALSENGPIPNPEFLMKKQIRLSWFLTWKGKFLNDGSHNDIDHLKKVYNSPYVITLDELPDLKSYKSP